MDVILGCFSVQFFSACSRLYAACSEEEYAFVKHRVTSVSSPSYEWHSRMWLIWSLVRLGNHGEGTTYFIYSIPGICVQIVMHCVEVLCGTACQRHFIMPVLWLVISFALPSDCFSRICEVQEFKGRTLNKLLRIMVMMYTCIRDVGIPGSNCDRVAGYPNELFRENSIVWYGGSKHTRNVGRFLRHYSAQHLSLRLLVVLLRLSRRILE